MYTDRRSGHPSYEEKLPFNYNSYCSYTVRMDTVATYFLGNLFTEYLLLNTSEYMSLMCFQLFPKERTFQFL